MEQFKPVLLETYELKPRSVTINNLFSARQDLDPKKKIDDFEKSYSSKRLSTETLKKMNHVGRKLMIEALMEEVKVIVIEK